MSSGSSTQQQQASTTTNTINPQEMAMLQGNYATVQQNAASLTPYTGQTVAGFNPVQNQAQNTLLNIAGNPLYQANNAAALAGVQGILNNPVNGTITPQSVTPAALSVSPVPFNTVTGASVAAPAPVTYNPVTAGLLANTDLSPYENPYTADVINASIAQNEQARQMAQTNDSQQATAANAFGGSRSGVAAALTNGQYDLNDQANIANLNAQNFAQAQAAATGDLNRQFSANQFNAGNALNAGEFNTTTGLNAAQYNATNAQNAALANQSAGLNAGEFSASQALQAALANQNAGINTGEFNAGQAANAQEADFNNQLAAAGLTINAAGQLVALNNNALGTATQQAGLLSAVGDAQQQQEQQQLTAAYNNYLQGQQLTVEQQQLLNSALGMFPTEQTVNSSGTSSSTSSSQTESSPGLTDILGSVSKLGSDLGTAPINGLGGSGLMGLGNLIF